MSSHASTVNISALTDSIRKLSYQPSHNQITEQINKTQSATMALTEDPRTLQLALELTMVGLNDTTTNNSNSYSVQSIIINNNQNDYDINSAFTARTEMPIISNVSTESGLPMPTSTGLEDRSKKSQNMTECVPVPSSEHVAEIVGRQGCKIKALRAKTNTYIKTPVRGEEPVFVVTGRKEDVNKAKREILSAADHFSLIRASRKPSTDSADNGITGIISTAGNNAGQLANVVVRANQSGPPCLPGQITIHVRVPYRVVGLVVGPKGATIKHIQQETQTYIVTPSREKEPIFEVTGLPEHVETARKQIEAHIALRTGNNSSNGVGGGQGSENGTTDSLDSSEFVTLHTINTLSQILNDENSDILSSIYKGNDSYVVVDNNAQLKSNDSISNNHLTGNSININPLVHNSVVTSCFSSSEPLATASTATTTQIVNQVGSKTNTLFRNPISNTKTLSFCPPSPSVVLSTSSSSTTHSVSASILTRSCSSASSTASTKSTNNSAHSTSNSVNTPPELLNVWKSLNDSIDIDEGIGDSPSIWSLPTGAIVTAASNCSPTASISPTDSLFAEHSLKISKTTNSSVEHRPQLQINSDKSLMQRECFVCNEKEVTTALVPCGHNMFCMDCANQICVSMESICPICHSIVYHAMRILA